MSNTTQTPPNTQSFDKELPEAPTTQSFNEWLSSAFPGDVLAASNPYAIGYRDAKARYDAEQLDPEQEKKRLKIARNLTGMVDTIGLLGDIVNASLGGNVKARTESATSEAGKKLEKERQERQARMKELYGDLTKERAQALAGAHQLYTDEINKAYKDYATQLGEYQQQRADYNADRQHAISQQDANIRQQNANTAQTRAEAYRIAQQNQRTADDRAKSRANTAVNSYWKGAYTFNLGNDSNNRDVVFKVTPTQYASINSAIVNAIGTGVNPTSGTIAAAYNDLQKLAETRKSGVTKGDIQDITSAYTTLKGYVTTVASRKNERHTAEEIQNMIGGVVGLANALTRYNVPEHGRSSVDSMLAAIQGIYSQLSNASTASATGAQEVYDRVYGGNITGGTERQPIDEVLNGENWGNDD